jgi:hypothetical protein
MMKHTTCPQPHKQLLMGWIAGGPMMMMTEGDREDTTTMCNLLSGWMGGRGDNDEFF